MRITVTLDGELLKEASVLTGISEMSVLLRVALEALVERETPEPENPPEGEDLPEPEGE